MTEGTTQDDVLHGTSLVFTDREEDVATVEVADPGPPPDTDPIMVPPFIQTTLDVKEMEKLHRQQGIIKEEVLNHLLFHKALIDDNNDREPVDYDRYIKMVNDLHNGYHLTMDDPFDMSIAITFELVIEQKLDPWDLDLMKFTRLYLQHANEQDELDLITAGKIILMAWSILRIKSDSVLEKAEQEPEEEVFYGDGAWDFIMDDGDFEFTREVIANREPPIKEMVWRKGKRPVTLLELVGAFEEARRESIEAKEHNRKRLEMVKANLISRKKSVKDNMHGDVLEDDIHIVWDRILQFNGTTIPMSLLQKGNDREDLILVLRSLLFLAHRKWVKIHQKNFPYGEIYVKNIFDPERSLIPDSIKNDPATYKVLFGSTAPISRGLVLSAETSPQPAGGIRLEPHEMGLNT